MYQAFYSLKSKPFQITTDPKFLWMGEKHREALATLKYGILENKGFLMLTGDIGTGKTALINALVDIIEVAAIVASIPDPGLENLDFFNMLAEEFKMNKRFDSKGSFLIHLKHFLHKAFADDKKVLLVIDEAQRLNHDLLEQIRLLSNIEMNNRKLINIFFVGQTEFNDMLREERNKAIRQRISVTYHIDPLSENETWHYIRHRLKIAGTTEEIFQSKAIKEIYAFSQGYPRLINIICDHALLTGYASGIKSIGVKVVSECEKELHIPIDAKKPEVSTAPQPVNQIEESTPPPREQPVGKRSIFLILTLILFISAGYFIYYINLEKSPRWAMEDIAPQKYDSPALREKETFIPGVTDKKKEQPDQRGQAPGTAEPAEIEKKQQSPIVTAKDQNASAPKNQDNDDKIADRKTLIYFKHNSNELPDEAFKSLDQIAQFMVDHPGTNVNVKGYTDSTGGYSYNISVSQFRANSIKSYLVGKGVNSSRIKAVGLGPENPIATNNTEAGRRQNRRVEIEFEINSSG